VEGLRAGWSDSFGSVTGADTRIEGGNGMAAPEGFSDKVVFVWKVADKLRGHFKPHEYGSVMLPARPQAAH
jgi:hypothetical protein